jgi:hypothetical protein
MSAIKNSRNTTKIAVPNCQEMFSVRAIGIMRSSGTSSAGWIVEFLVDGGRSLPY